MNLISVSIVIYKNNFNELKEAIQSCLNSSLVGRIYLIDNSPSDSLMVLAEIDSERIIYLFQNKNLGFGKAHNVGINLSLKEKFIYHIILNPDIYFNSKVIEILYEKAINDFSIGLLAPKIFYPNGETQYLCKLIPRPLDLLIRRFIPFEEVKKRIDNRYELKFFNYKEEALIPVLSGCFMFIKSSILKEVKGFDERFFMYLEDVDLSRRIGEISKTIFYPYAEVIHKYEKGSYKNKKLLIYHIKSTVKYFNKWGWFFDKKRNNKNIKTLNYLNYKNK